MKHLLVPTDFSGCAALALDFAAALARRSGAKLTLYHVFPPVPPGDDHHSTVATLPAKQAVRSYMARLLNSVRPKLPPGHLQGLVEQGNREQLIADKADKGHYDLIVMGSRGAGHWQRFLFGSTTLSVIRRANTPVLAIPGGVSPVHPINKIVLADDGRGISSPQQLAALAHIARIYQAKVKIFHQVIDPDNDDQEPPVSITAALHDIPFRYFSQLPPPGDISDTIHHFVQAERAGLLCLIHRRKGLMEWIFEENVTRDSLSDSPIPLLIVRG